MSLFSLSWKSPKPSFSFVPKVRKAVSQRALDIAEAVWVGAVHRTPVRTGELRASWNLSKSKPIYVHVESTGGMLPPPSMPKLVATALSSAKYYVTNGAPHAKHVEFGSTTILPHLMMTRAVQSVDL